MTSLVHSRELTLTCDTTGVVRAIDERARRRLGDVVGRHFATLAYDGAANKAEALIMRARTAEVDDWEIPMAGLDGVATYLWSAWCEGDDVVLLGFAMPESFTTAVTQVQDNLEEVVVLSRETARQKKELERAYKELEESANAVRGLHAELEDKARSLSKTADLKGRLVSNVSHEFRTPLHTIMAITRLMADEMDGPLSGEQRKQLGFVREAAAELNALVNDLLDLAKANSDAAGVRIEPVAMIELLSTLRGQLRPLFIPTAGVELAFDAVDDQLVVHTDRGKLAQIIRNLVSNALKFTEQGSVRVATRVHGEWLEISVKDTGIGIPLDQQELIFEEFVQLDGPQQRRTQGTGLGLPLARRLAILLGGSLSVESTPGQGATFTVSLPRAAPDETVALANIERKRPEPGKAPILVVEDDARTIVTYERFLAQAGFHVIPARSTDAAETIMMRVRPAAIVLDILLDNETTWAFLARLKSREETRDIPVLVVTVTVRPEKARALGADEFWIKPVDPQRLATRIQRLAKKEDRPRILVVDDDERFRYLFERMLSDGRHELHQAATGEEGVRLAREIQPDIVFLDFLLQGGVTAFDVLDQLKADPATRQIPVVIVTAHDLGVADRQRLDLNSEEVLSKEHLSREVALHRIRDALATAGVTSEKR